MLVFSNQLCQLLPPLTFSLVHLSPPPFPKSKYRIYRQCGWEGGRGVLSCVWGHILQEFKTLFLTRFRSYKSALHPKQKPRRKGGLQTDKHLPHGPFTGQLFRLRHLALLSISLTFLRGKGFGTGGGTVPTEQPEAPKKLYPPEQIN